MLANTKNDNISIHNFSIIIARNYVRIMFIYHPFNDYVTYGSNGKH